jgi:NAD(P)-dependent dehydrogenase (short-subunit alcohol dehydrogenase family)
MEGARVVSAEPTVQQLFDLTGKVALVTGGTGHLGSAMSRALAEAGASVVVTSRDRDRARTAAAALPRVGGAEHHGVMLDQMESASLEAGFTEAVRAADHIDVLVNNGHEALSEDCTDVTHEAFSRQWVNASGYLMRRDSSGSAP